MHVKFLSTVIFIGFCSPAFSETTPLPAPWHASHYGVCYKSLKSGMSAVYGQKFDEDQEILRNHRKIGSKEFVIASDSASGTNSQRTIFERRTANKWCVVLTSPPVADLSPSEISKTSRRPMIWTTTTQASPGFTETKVIYKWDLKQKIYLPYSCQKGNEKHWQSFDCNKAYN